MLKNYFTLYDKLFMNKFKTLISITKTFITITKIISIIAKNYCLNFQQ